MAEATITRPDNDMGQHPYNLECGCRLVSHGSCATFTYCSLHKAAPALLEALERIVGPYYLAEGPDQQITVQEDVQAREAIAQAHEVPTHA